MLNKKEDLNNLCLKIYSVSAKNWSFSEVFLYSTTLDSETFYAILFVFSKHFHTGLAGPEVIYLHNLVCLFVKALPDNFLSQEGRIVNFLSCDGFF